MPDDGIRFVSRDNILSLEEIFDIAQSAVNMGIDKVRLTGGEPLVRKGIVKLVSLVSGIEGIKDLSLTTNGILLERYAKELAQAGLHRVNISLDTMNPKRYKEITRIGDISDVLAGIKAAKEAGLNPIRLNCVIEESTEEQDAKEVAQFANDNNLEARFIRRMNMPEGAFWRVHGGYGGYCEECNRLRVSSDGFIKPCLFSDLAFSIRELGAKEAIRRAVEAKPKNGELSKTNTFYGIGG
ncbi:MAG: GTP 3',8-cyclase MoaA [Planctomycetota bacterium]|jgi:cyclic pyranopterin phosphate synthase